MIVLARRAPLALAALSLLAMAGCAQIPAEPVKGVFEFTKFATTPGTMPDFVQATRPAEKGDYLPVGVDAPARTLKPKAAPAAAATRKELEDAAKANEALTGAQPKP